MNAPATMHTGPLGSTIHVLRADFPVLCPGSEPRKLDASEVIDGFTPEDTCEAVEGVRFSLTCDERTEAVARIVRRRRRSSVRAREPEPEYASSV